MSRYITRVTHISLHNVSVDPIANVHWPSQGILVAPCLLDPIDSTFTMCGIFPLPTWPHWPSQGTVYAPCLLDPIDSTFTMYSSCPLPTWPHWPYPRRVRYTPLAYLTPLTLPSQCIVVALCLLDPIDPTLAGYGIRPLPTWPHLPYPRSVCYTPPFDLVSSAFTPTPSQHHAVRTLHLLALEDNGEIVRRYRFEFAVLRPDRYSRYLLRKDDASYDE